MRGYIIIAFRFNELRFLRTEFHLHSTTTTGKMSAMRFVNHFATHIHWFYASFFRIPFCELLRSTYFNRNAEKRGRSSTNRVVREYWNYSRKELKGTGSSTFICWWAVSFSVETTITYHKSVWTGIHAQIVSNSVICNGRTNGKHMD